MTSLVLLYILHDNISKMIGLFMVLEQTYLYHLYTNDVCSIEYDNSSGQTVGGNITHFNVIILS